MAKDENDQSTGKTARYAPLTIRIDNSAQEDVEIERRPGQPSPPKRQSSFAQYRPDGVPRTPNRVRFNVEDMTPQTAEQNGHAKPADGGVADDSWVEDEDYLGEDESEAPMLGQRAPLLTDLEAPSITLATMEFDPEDHLESAKPRSNMRNAFMNMANSIM
jgi:sodium-coupled neutral amino acid transporter 11